MERQEKKITSLLQLKLKLEQEVRADINKIEEIKKHVEQRRGWIHFLDEVLSESSFQPASALLAEDFNPEDVKHASTLDSPEPLSVQRGSTVNITDDFNILLATVTFMEGNIFITFSESVSIDPRNPYFKEAFQDTVLSSFEREGGKIYSERDDAGSLKSISILGTFNQDLR
ncbi:hypothetical protein GF325_14285, partial [Candidatus Bathyarchaeota archaeon]|nr:hypothetical protein [Candidatus Bathyarchaeota archaeon]